MKYQIPNDLINMNIDCFDTDVYSNMFTFEYCKSVCKGTECWKEKLKDTINYHCNVENQVKFEKLNSCENCQSKNIEFSTDSDANSEEYLLICKDCDYSKYISKSEIKEKLKDEYLEINEKELEEKIEQAIKKDKINSNYKCGRNDPCPCGSGKKYKHCCGKN